MAAPANTRLSYNVSDGDLAAIGIREDLSNIISNISPMETPFVSSIGKSSASNTLFQWQTDTLTAPAGGTSGNRQVEGDDMTANAPVEPTLLSNYTQISRKVIFSSATADAVDWAGRKTALAYQLAKASKEMKRQMESMLLGNTGSSAGKGSGGGDTAAARATAGLRTWLTSNTDLGSGGADNAAGTAATDGTQRTLTEAMIKTVAKSCFESGGNPDTILCGTAQKQTISGFASSSAAGYPVAQAYITADRDSQASMVAAIDVYTGDFGTYKIKPDLWIGYDGTGRSSASAGRDVFLLDAEYWDVAYLRPWRAEELAKTGDSAKRAIVVEYGLRAKNEASSGVVADIT
tara:strand:+ start:968 stop:2011 length:1044 start_codon:yes stop_codon:yes gene_type:complete